MSLSRPVLAVIIGSTRPGRAGEPIARWFYDLAVAHGGFDVELVDLAEVNLPIYDEPVQPVRRTYAHDHTKRWSERVERADAFVFVIPEYNHGLNAAIKNAVDFLYHEWRYKPFGVVSYGGASKGLRAAQALTPSLVALRMFLAGDVAITLLTTPVVENVFPGNEELEKSANDLLDELTRFAPIFQPFHS
ncbi:MAG TPA: NAD(P)H-dependent oxidoreductase [Acidimicrobiales bacterium]|nr:NAD(P)H-dependent oxidoreductase [Acidimicrobiales bacterium]